MLPILYQDDHLVAIHKPSDLLVHRSSLDAYETRFAVQLLRDQIGQHVFPAHRLDKATSGVLLFGLNSDSARALSMQFAERQVAKNYLAVVRGWPDEQGEIDHPLEIRKDDAEVFGGIVEKAAQASQTHYRRIASVELPWMVDKYPSSRYALVTLDPITGRRHQIRRHLKHLSHPIIGDTTYGKGRHNRAFAQAFGVNRLLLACTQMQFKHPISGQMLSITAPVAADMSWVIQELGCLAALDTHQIEYQAPQPSTSLQRQIFV
ncbi:tRNA pseudouridine(65) synthase TruC [Deefgea piscis]|uniref:tRNA pseudouridine synthase C n=1 Tax=Deefgea piscis TaxID=2739061 RepID=A0A6M8SSZ0_9NEIS|nr:tRNA pseudouridine(65) synthase TruC [Deefgea piscis]QKJ67821.1 tRNA pseudouridine(65) synthase TruC [Deefgea piscis]